MTGFEAKCKLHDLKITAGMSYRYHQRLESFYAKIDRGIRIAVGILAVSGLIFALMHFHFWDVLSASLSLIVAYILNVASFGEWEKKHGELFRLWSALRMETELKQLKADELDDYENVPAILVEQIEELTKKSFHLDADEPSPNQELLNECHGDEIESIYGKGIRTNEEAMGYRQQLIEQYADVTSASAGEAAEGALEAAKD